MRVIPNLSGDKIYNSHLLTIQELTVKFVGIAQREALGRGNPALIF